MDPFPAGRTKRWAIRYRPVSDDDFRFGWLAAKQLLQRFQRVSRVAPLLDNGIGHLAFIINCAPQEYLLTADPADHLVVAPAW
jgi:hypothetical protein